MKTLSDVYAAAEKRFADRELYKIRVDEKIRSVRGTEFFADVAEAAFTLKAHGVGKGDRVVVISPKCYRQATIFWALWRVGAVVVPVCETLAAGERKYVLSHCRAKCLYCHPALAGDVAEFADGPIRTTDALFTGKSGQVATPSAVAPDDPAVVVYTSGSTGNPKGVVLTHLNLTRNASDGVLFARLDGHHNIMSILPYWHSFALTAELIPMLFVGGTVSIPRDRADFVKNAADYAPTVILSVPRLARALQSGILAGVEKSGKLAQIVFNLAYLASDAYFSDTAKPSGGFCGRLVTGFFEKAVFTKIRKKFGGQLEFFIGGGAPLDADTQRFFRNIRLPMYQGYGLTETSPIISINSAREHKLGSSGKMIGWLDRDGGDFTFADGAGNRGRDIEGELLVRGQCVMPGYFGDDAENARVFTPDGWFRTGDVGYLDRDGYLFLTGRAKNLVVLEGGEKFGPEAVEEILKRSRFIADAMIFGEGAKTPAVLLNIDKDWAAGQNPDEIPRLIDAEIARLTEDLDAYKRPRRFAVVPDFNIEDGTLTSTGKIRRHAVHEKHAALIATLTDR